MSLAQPPTEVVLGEDGNVLPALREHGGALQVQLRQADSVAESAVGVPEDQPRVAQQPVRDGGDVLPERPTLAQATVGGLVLPGRVVTPEI